MKRLIPYIRNNIPDYINTEVIIADGKSTDATREIADYHYLNLIPVNVQNRAYQMNVAANQAKGNVLYFLHADTFPPANFIQCIQEATNRDLKAGSFRLSFDMNHWFLSAFAWFTQFNVTPFRFGDQSLFVKNEEFQAIDGFDENLLVMEDQEIVYRLKKHLPFAVIQNPVISSARKYRENGIYYQQGLYFLAYLGYYLGVDPKRLKHWVGKH